jgi:hypothetical protein
MFLVLHWRANCFGLGESIVADKLASFSKLLYVKSGGGAWNNNRQSWQGHWGGDKAGLRNASIFGSHNGNYASSSGYGGGGGGGGFGGGGKKKSFIFQLSA